MANYLALYQGDNAIFNSGTNDETSINLLWNKISAISNSKEKPIYKNSRIGDIKYSVLNNHKAKKYLSWETTLFFRYGIKRNL
jgi:UDP-glucose 4-epimerase